MQRRTAEEVSQLGERRRHLQCSGEAALLGQFTAELPQWWREDEGSQGRSGGQRRTPQLEERRRQQLEEPPQKSGWGARPLEQPLLILIRIEKRKGIFFYFFINLPSHVVWYFISNFFFPVFAVSTADQIKQRPVRIQS